MLENEATLTCADSPAGPAPDVDMSAYDAWTKVRAAPDFPAPPTSADTSTDAPSTRPRNAPPWWVAIDFPHPVAVSLVATMLIRPMSDVVFPGGVRGSTLYGAAPGVFGGSTLGVSLQYGTLFVPARFTVAGDANALVVSGFGGLGGAWNVLPHTSVYAAAALRYTAMAAAAGWFDNQVDGALLVGVRRRFWGSRRCVGDAATGGFELFLEAAAPIASNGPWFVSAGVTNSWGPGGGYPWFVSLARCKR